MLNIMDGQLQYMLCQSYCYFRIFIYSWFPIGFNVLLCFVFVRSPFIPVLLRIRRWQSNIRLQLLASYICSFETEKLFEKKDQSIAYIK